MRSRFIPKECVCLSSQVSKQKAIAIKSTITTTLKYSQATKNLKLFYFNEKLNEFSLQFFMILTQARLQILTQAKFKF